jgi:hypothetical protein
MEVKANFKIHLLKILSVLSAIFVFGCFLMCHKSESNFYIYDPSIFCLRIENKTEKTKSSPSMSLGHVYSNVEVYLD